MRLEKNRLIEAYRNMRTIRDFPRFAPAALEFPARRSTVMTSSPSTGRPRRR